MTATIIRLKRRLDDDAVDSFLVNTKRRKVDSVESDNDGLSTIFNFVGTGKSPEDVFEHIKKSAQSEVKTQSKFETSNIIKKLKNEWQKNSKSDRFKVVNSFRFSNDTEQASSTDVSCTIVDVESNGKGVTDTELLSSENVVYDFYTTNEVDATAELYEDALENVLSVCPLNKDMFCFRDEGDIDSDESDDSNAENYFANDYPDESEESDEEDDDGDDEDNKHFRKQFGQVNFDDSYDDYYDEDNDLTKSDCDEYDGSCTP